VARCTVNRVPPSVTPRRRALPAELALVISLAGFVACWHLVVLAFDYPPFILPTPALVAQRIAGELAGGTLLHHTGVTVRAALSGYGYAAVISIALGYLLAVNRRIERIVAPQLAATQAIPVVAIAPLIILWLGNGPESRTLVAALVTFFPILSGTIVAFRAVPREYIEMARISGAGWWQTLRLVEAPLALRGIFGGAKAGLALATTGAVVGEFVGGRDGLGALITIARGLFDTPLMFAALAMLAALTLAGYLITTVIERLVITWE